MGFNTFKICQIYASVASFPLTSEFEEKSALQTHIINLHELET